MFFSKWWYDLYLSTVLIRIQVLEYNQEAFKKKAGTIKNIKLTR